MKKNYELLIPTPVENSMKISNRIYTLVAFCLGLLTVVSGISIWQMNNISAEIEGISQREIPLTEGLTQITIQQFDQSITFERAFRAGEVMNTYPRAKGEFSTAVRKFKALTEKIDQDFSSIKVIVQRALDTVKTPKGRQIYQSMMTLIGKLDEDHKVYDLRSRQAFKLIENGRLEQALALLPKIEAEEDYLDQQLGNLLIQLELSTKRAVRTAQEHEDFALNLLVLLTNFSLIMGTGAAVFMVRRRITRPLREIVAGLDALSSGDMSVDVKVYCDDEIGAVARSYEVFKHSLVEAQAQRG